MTVSRKVPFRILTTVQHGSKGRVKGGGEEEIYHDHASRKQKGTGEKRQNESREFQRCVFLERCGFGGLSRGGFPLPQG